MQAYAATIERAQALAGEAEQTARRRRLNCLLALIQLARGIGSLTAGNYAEAFDALRVTFDPADPTYHPVERFHGVMFLAEAAMHGGHVERAVPILTELEQDTLTTPSPTVHVQLSYARAVLADDTDAESLYLAALRQDLVRWPWARARIELAYGTWLRRQRRVAESRSPLRAAHTTLSLIGATAWAEQALTELRAAGERSTEPVQAVHEVLVAPRNPDRTPRRGRPLEPGDRRTALPLPPHRRIASLSHLPQARHHFARADLRAAGVRLERRGRARRPGRHPSCPRKGSRSATPRTGQRPRDNS